MNCPHGANSTPTTCSLCLGAAARIVTVVAGVAHVDGSPLMPASEPKVSYGRGARRKR